MNQSIQKSTFLIKSNKNESIGTGFVVNKDEKGTCLVTCAHVVKDCGENTLMVEDHKAKLLYIGSRDAIDLALIYVEGLDSVVLKLSDVTVSQGVLFKTYGFWVPLGGKYKLEMLKGSIKKLSTFYSGSQKIDSYDLSIGSDDNIKDGYSGSAILCPSSGYVIAVATIKYYGGTKAGAIPIGYLRSIWQEMPDGLLHHEPCLDMVKEETSSSTGLTDKALVRILKLQDKIDELETKLKTSNKPEEQLELSALLDEVRKEKDKKDMEIKSLNEFIENSNLKVVRKATEISEEKGLEATLEYFNSEKFTKFEKNIQSNMKELVGGYLFQAKALQLENRYDEVKEAYKKALKYDRTVDTLFDYAYFLERSFYFDEAINMYEQLLPKQRALAKTNPSAVATTLNRLGYRYWYKYKEPLKKQLQKAEEALDEALKIRMVLAKTNPKVYNPYVVETLENLVRLYKTKNQIQKAKEVYKELLTYDQSYVSHDNYARFLKSQNYIDEAAEVYKQMLQERRNLAKNDPDVYTNEVISLLFDLASLYGDAGQLQKAKEAYSELLEITKAQVKANPGFHEFSLAYVLALGVDILNLPSTNLDEAEVILQKYKGKNNVKDALYYIGKLRKQ